MPRLHPNLADLYRHKFINLAEALNDANTRLEAAKCIRDLIEEIRLVPNNGKLQIELYGELAALINLGNQHPPLQGNGGATMRSFRPSVEASLREVFHSFGKRWPCSFGKR
jgi:hypothetical protein